MKMEDFISAKVKTVFTWMEYGFIVNHSGNIFSTPKKQKQHNMWNTPESRFSENLKHANWLSEGFLIDSFWIKAQIRMISLSLVALLEHNFYNIVDDMLILVSEQDPGAAAERSLKKSEDVWTEFTDCECE